MKTTLELIENVLDIENGFRLRITIDNTGVEDWLAAVDGLSRNAESVALEFRQVGGDRIGPIEYKVITPMAAGELLRLRERESKILEICGTAEEKLPGVVALVFPLATYRLDRNACYSVKVNWGEFNSEPITIRIGAGKEGA
ncbi:hypothetical protein M5J07_21640 [Achromobacter mucicolens]|uniref:hypothetical protein n=1 Tax=Achromobacter mucicolens TaxID=1389922 RepID=UPI0020A2DBFC|nr:hypothetical protein [Achromobacter mucicolens]MCP2517555.1 hypothetical protein [Achromobacter mucicolens]